MKYDFRKDPSLLRDILFGLQDVAADIETGGKNLTFKLKENLKSVKVSKLVYRALIYYVKLGDSGSRRFFDLQFLDFKKLVDSARRVASGEIKVEYS